MPIDLELGISSRAHSLFGNWEKIGGASYFGSVATVFDAGNLKINYFHLKLHFCSEFCCIQRFSLSRWIFGAFEGLVQKICVLRVCDFVHRSRKYATFNACHEKNNCWCCWTFRFMSHIHKSCLTLHVKNRVSHSGVMNHIQYPESCLTSKNHVSLWEQKSRMT